MPDALCVPHKNRGVLARASKIVNGVLMCMACFEGKEIVAPNRFTSPSERPEEDFRLPADVEQKAREVVQKTENTKQEARMKFDAVAAQNDRSDGMKVADIAKKYGVTPSAIYLKTKPAKNGTGPARAARTPRQAVSAPKSSQGGPYAAALADLREKRDKLDQAIAAIESLG